ncbi:interleukin-18 receptor 1-like [Xyrichtys novacula]|uniref:Interleukin-18 receptor 1-like n=1 Tax=Xyrichtys novacula TaxID=13765 RepID=A0AAV1ELP0_XYRNO|nr:interleukin-18 receptor 1-like [Xyrichtys novacula]
MNNIPLIGGCFHCTTNVTFFLKFQFTSARRLVWGNVHFYFARTSFVALFAQITFLATLLLVWLSLLPVMMQVKVLLVPLCLLLASLAGVCSLGPKNISVEANEMVALQCNGAENQSGAKVIWTSPNTKERELSSDMSSAEQRQAGVLLYGRSLVILSANVSHQGNYSCSLRHNRTSMSQTWFRLRVYTTQSREYEEKPTYPTTCYIPESCTLYCPDANTPDVATPNITSNGVIWQKEGESMLNHEDSITYLSVEENHHGVYICTRSYLYLDQTYNMTFKAVLDVRPNNKSEKSAVIILPNDGDVVHVDLGSSVVIPCKAATFSDHDSLFWLSGDSFVDEDKSLPFFSNITSETNRERKIIINSLIIKKVTKELLSKNYTCKLDSEDRPSTFVTITLAQKARPSYASLAAGIVCTVMAMVLMTVIYVKFKINITLLLRDTLGCHRNASDGKSYDAFLMCYKNNTDAGLNEEDRDLLEKVLEEKFGYSLCLYDRDVPPGKGMCLRYT